MALKRRRRLERMKARQIHSKLVRLGILLKHTSSFIFARLVCLIPVSKNLGN